MCGIGGIVRFDDQPIDPSRAQAMLDRLRPRGGDGQAVQHLERCTLVHARLSIIDHAGGAQPMQAAATATHGPLTTVFNGMIYNHRELRRQLEQHGHRFTSDHSDTEVLLHGYRQWGAQLPKRLQGQFAFAIWDQDDRRLFLCRDRMGKKPLYVCQNAGELVFSSLVSAISCGTTELDEHALLNFLRWGYTFDESLIKGIAQLPAAHYMTIDASGKINTAKYWCAPEAHGQQTVGQPEPHTDLRSALEQAVSTRLEADAPLGCFLSGGIDSSIVAALAQQQLSANGAGPLRTFSVAMQDTDYDEGPYARLVAQHIGSEHTELIAEPAAGIIDDLDYLVQHTGQPMADSSLLPTYWISRAARAHVKVALTGDGGDELFAGYDRYRAMMLLKCHGWWLRRTPSFLFCAGSAKPQAAGTRLRRLADAARWRQPAQQYGSIMHLFSDEQIRQLGIDLPDFQSSQSAVPDWPEGDPVNSAMLWDRQHYLPHDLLRKVDRAAMAVALEVRCPLLDTQVVQLASHLTAEQLMPRGRSKALLRDVAAQLLPASIASRPKQGFAIPIKQWFCGPLRQSLGERLLDGSLDQFGFHRPAIEKMYRQHVDQKADHTHRLYALLTLALWRKWLPAS